MPPTANQIMAVVLRFIPLSYEPAGSRRPLALPRRSHRCYHSHNCTAASPGGTAGGVSEPIGKFQIMGTLGTGAHSTILHIRRSRDAKNYALKVVPIDGPDDHKFLEQAQHE